MTRSIEKKAYQGSGSPRSGTLPAAKASHTATKFWRLGGGPDEVVPPLDEAPGDVERDEPQRTLHRE